MREFGLILAGGLFSALLGAGFGWLIGQYAPEFVKLLFLQELQSPVQVATAMGAISGLFIGAAAMSVGLLVAAMRARVERRG